jgi:DNA/RNA endonuclease G (NUC1)
MYQLKFHLFLQHKSGHLAARGDFVYANEQRSTFNYINVAPQVREREVFCRSLWRGSFEIVEIFR